MIRVVELFFRQYDVTNVDVVTAGVKPIVTNGARC